jgi:D-arabinose 1-dehydrogenase-like Zn-dependent alcohol dehydrogenase
VREPELLGQTVVVIGGSAGIGLDTARRARAEGADVILTGRNANRLKKAASELGALSTATFFEGLEAPIDHVMVTAGGPYYASLADMDFDEARRALQEHPMVMLGGPATPPAGSVREARCSSLGAPGPAIQQSASGSARRAHRRAPRSHGQPCARDRPGAHQPDRRRLRRHTLVGVTARRPARRAP